MMVVFGTETMQMEVHCTQFECYYYYNLEVNKNSVFMWLQVGGGMRREKKKGMFILVAVVFITFCKRDSVCLVSTTTGLGGPPVFSAISY